MIYEHGKEYIIRDVKVHAVRSTNCGVKKVNCVFINQHCADIKCSEFENDVSVAFLTRADYIKLRFLGFPNGQTNS